MGSLLIYVNFFLSVSGKPLQHENGKRSNEMQYSHEFSLNWFFAVENGEREKFVGLDSSSSSWDVIIAVSI